VMHDAISKIRRENLRQLWFIHNKANRAGWPLRLLGQFTLQLGQVLPGIEFRS
jgi:hypothetical protein